MSLFGWSGPGVEPHANFPYAGLIYNSFIFCFCLAFSSVWIILALVMCSSFFVHAFKLQLLISSLFLNLFFYFSSVLPYLCFCFIIKFNVVRMFACKYSQWTAQQVGSVHTVCMSLLPPPFWLAGFRFSIKCPCTDMQGIFFFFSHPFSYFIPVSASQQETAYIWFRDLFCSCAFSWLKEKVLVLIQSSVCIYKCICAVTAIYSLACCDVVFYFMYRFKPLLCRNNSLQANVK